MCHIDQIADLPYVDTVWFCLDGVANTLSSQKIVADSKRKMNYSTIQYYQIKNVMDLSYRCIISISKK